MLKTEDSRSRRPADNGHVVAALRTILADRERELLELKGPCSTSRCRLHYAHSGPCDLREAAGGRQS